jgi:alkylated DNA nucleotide flippase Atl1
MGNKGTGAGKEVGEVPAASRVGGNILKNIGEDDYVKWFRNIQSL